MVIQEAFTCGRPLLVSDIGGMREKVRDGVDGFHVPAGNVLAWAATFRRLAAQPEAAWDALVQGIRKPLSHQQCASEHLGSVLVTSEIQ